MRGPLAIVKATALEVLSEPLTLLVLLAALVLTVVTPVFHYHQFGEATRMARDAGLSALLTCGGVLGVFAAIRTIRRERETGTFEMALAHPLSRECFFLSKAVGILAAVAVFVLTVGAALVTGVIGAAVGGRLAEKTGEVARVWAPCVAGGLATLGVPLVAAAVLNRFARFRFVLTSVALAFALAVGGAVAFSAAVGVRELSRLLPAVVLVALLVALLALAAAAFAVRCRANLAASLTAVVTAALVPFVGNYYLADALANGGSVGWGYVGLASAALLPAHAAFLILGARLCREID